MMPQACPEPSAREGARKERGDRQQRRWNRKILCVRNREAQKYDVAGHVGHEDVARFEIAYGVDQPGDHREDEQQKRQRAMPLVGSETQRINGTRADRHLVLQ